MRWQPGRSPEEGATFSAADAPRRRTLASGRCRGRRRWSGSLFAASAGSSALSPLPSSPPSSSDGTCASESSGSAVAPAGVRLSGLVALDPGYLRLKPPRRSRTESQRNFAMRKKSTLRVASPALPGELQRE